MRTLLATIALCVALGLLSGCGGGSVTTVPAANLIGTWKTTQIGAPVSGTTGGTTTITCPGSITLPSNTFSCTADDTLTFNADNTFSSLSGAVGAQPQSGTWSIFGSTLTTVVTTNVLTTTTTTTTTYSVQLAANNATLTLTTQSSSSSPGLVGTFSVLQKQ